MKNISESYRYERKFIIPYNNKFSINHLIKTSNLRFLEQYNSRKVNSIYLDTPNLRFYQDNINGLSKRLKFRIRWYGEEEIINEPFLEIKSKNNDLGEKKIISIKKFVFNESATSLKEIKNSLLEISKSKLFNYELSQLVPTLFISYSRKYFISRMINCRLTIDDNVLYQRLSNISQAFKTNFIFDNNMILELKYPSKLEFNRFSQYLNLPFRMTKNSKYVAGLNKFLLS